MPGTLVYTPRRRNTMQALMWLVLAAVVGLAALVDRHLSFPSAAELGPDHVNGPLHFRLPANWAIASRARDNPLIVGLAIQRSDSGGEEGSRSIAVYRQHLLRQMEPQAYLIHSGLLDDIYGNSTAQATPSRLGGRSAIRIDGQIAVQLDDATIIRSETLICAIFPNHQAVTIRLSKYGELTEDDSTLLDDVAAAIKMDNQP